MPTTMKLSDEEAVMIRSARDQIMRGGLAQLEGLEAACPKCGERMDGVRLTAEHWDCAHCGHAQDGLKLGVGGTLALGAVAGAGIVALLWWLSTQSNKE